jgi:integrase
MKGYIRKRGKKYSYTVDIGIDPQTGKRKQKTKSGFATKKEAQAALTEILAKLNDNEYVEPSKILLKDFLLDWLDNSAKQKLRTSTYENHRIVIEKQIIPSLGNIKLSEIKPIQIQKFYNDKVDAGLSADYVRYMHSILRKSFNHAVRWDMLTKNVVEVVEPPKLVDKDFTTWNTSEIAKFLSITEGHHYHIVYVLAVYTGMRQGEILGLRWKDCDFVNGKISVRQNLSRTKAGLIFQEPKTKNSKRQIGISQFVIESLKKHKREQNENKLFLGRAYQDLDLVCATEEGKPLSPRNVLRNLKNNIKKANVPVLRFHDLRHTHATLMLKQGVHPKIVSERLGHSKISVTLDRYSHVLPDMQKDAADNFEKAMKMGDNS